MRASLVAISLALVGCGGSSKTTSGSSTVAQPSAAHAAAAFQPTSFTVEVSGHGRPVIFIPGLTCDGHVWDETVKHLGGKVEAHVITLAGFAGHPAIDKPLLPTVHDELIAYIKDRHLDHPILVGHSLGGFMTFWVAATAPDLIGGAVPVDGAPFLPGLFDPNATVESARPFADQFRAQLTGEPDKFADGVKAFMGGSMHDPASQQAAIDAMGKSDPKATGDAMYFMMQTDLRPEVAKITAPVLMVVADTDGQTPRAALEASWKAQVDPIPTHEMVVVEHSKHFIMFDQPAALDAALDAFLAKH